MSNIQDTSSKVTVVERFREYYKTNKYLGGLIKVNRVIYIDKIGQEVHIRVPGDRFSNKHDKFFINGSEVSFKKEESNE